MTRLMAALISTALLTLGSSAQAANWVAGKHYSVIPQAQRTNVAPGKVEVMEVFSYGCPACNQFRPVMKKLKASLPANAQLVYLPASWNNAEAWPMFQRAYLTALSLGIADKAHGAMFDAVWKPDAPLAIMNADQRTLKSPLPTIEDAAKFYAKFGVKAEDFVGTANSFTISTKMKQADAFVRATGTDSTPTIIVAGKYRLTFVSAGGDWNLLEQLIHYLIQKEAAGK